VANPEYFTPGTDRLFVQQTATIPAGQSVQLGPEWYFKGDTDAGRGQQTTQAAPLYGVISIAAGGPALSDLALIVDVEGARSTPDEGARADLVLLTSPPQIATVNQIGARVPAYGKTWAPVVRNNGGVTASVTVVWVFERARYTR
jgi:hypothetical protein